MKKNLHDFFYNSEALILLAEFLHNVLLSRKRWQACETTHQKRTSKDKQFEEAFKRLHKSTDYKAHSADTLLKCKITRVSLPHGSNTVCINISPSQQKKGKNKNRIIKKQQTC